MKIRNYESRHCSVGLVLVVVVLLPAFSVSAKSQEPVKFVAHRLGQFRSEACGVGDFNGDGKLDIVAGPYWYEAPDWKAHQFRSLKGKVDEKGRIHSVDEKGIGYWDDFMNAPLDVDRDGLLDVVTCCWFSKQLDWYRNTGANGGQWPVTVGERDGNYECGDLWDIDGDGRKLEILTDTKETKWYEVGIGDDGKGKLVEHNVSQRQSPFGGGVGDINGDGRPDILRPDAWYEAPPDPRTGSWKEHRLAVGSLAEGQADHTPQIRVYDVDADGLNDIVTSSAHDRGIFWYKQIRKQSEISWKQHVIDQSWSQAHSITLADLDDDGDLDLVTGKRFFAHNGKDPDAYSPLGVYWYELRRGAAVEWIKHVISYDEGIGSGLNIPVVDIDGDGDLDIVVTGKWGGPVYFENTSDVTRAGINKSDIDQKLAAIVNYERGMSRQPLISVEKLIRESESRPEQRKYIELQLAELLSEATLECKSFICKQLWFIGTADSVPAIAKLLTDEDTADMACYAMGQNPSPEAGEALRSALEKVGPNVQIRIINLLGDRRDGQSAEAMGRLVFGAEKQVAEAAVAALGKIGGAQARKILAGVRASPDVSEQLRFTATDAYLRCAEDLVAGGQSEQATAIYKELAGQAEAALIRSAAIKGLADIGGPDAIPLVVTALRDQHRMVRTTAMSCVRTMGGEGVTELFAAKLPKASPDERVLLIGALADRGDAAALPSITTEARSTSANVRRAALQAVGKLGDASNVSFLVQTATEGTSSEEKSAAINSLKLLRGNGVDDTIVKSMQNLQPNMRSELINVLFERNAVGVVSPLLKEASSSDSKVRRAAFKALGRLAGEKDLPSLIKLLTSLQGDSGRSQAERAVVAVSRKISDDSKRADAVSVALRGEEQVAVRCSLLRVLGGIANSKALETLVAASKETDPAVRDTAVRALARWPDAKAAEALLEIFQSTQNQTHRLLALRGLVRSLALPDDNRRVQGTLEIYGRVLSGTRSPEERKLVLSGLANVSDPKALAMVQPFLQTEAVRAEAAMASIKIAGAIMQTHRDQARTAMNELLAVSQDKNLRKQAEEIIRQINELEDGTHP